MGITALRAHDRARVASLSLQQPAPAAGETSAGAANSVDTADVARCQTATNAGGRSVDGRGLAHFGWGVRREQSRRDGRLHRARSGRAHWGRGRGHACRAGARSRRTADSVGRPSAPQLASHIAPLEYAALRGGCGVLLACGRGCRSSSHHLVGQCLPSYIHRPATVFESPCMLHAIDTMRPTTSGRRWSWNPLARDDVARDLFVHLRGGASW